ncbi:phage major capsid protein, P2 family [Victivallis vadensis]|uniref:Phage major capsid protein, P2 family n=1 Tax=Victivallis vadensis TaxID=172901 RepID=A0A848ATK8_9BACT|nr:phage major capsid protein, P2 family [Victivallis vadensis]NMD86725.1 phage major capsid protein, P2 family [Victivallis vadensis]
MKRETQLLYNQLRANMAQAYGVENVGEQFSATIPMAQSLNDAVQESSDFLKLISIIPVEDIEGEILDMTIFQTIAGRKKITAGARREPQMAGAPDGRKYHCEKTNFDVGFAYALLDNWARYKDFQTRYMAAVYIRIALDRTLIGFYGTSAAETTDRAANPKLQDVNKGWLFDLKTNMKSHYFLGEGSTGSEKIVIGSGSAATYKNVDQMVYDVASLIPKHRRTGKEVAIVGQAFVAHDMNKILGAYGEKPSERIHFGTLAKSYGGFPSMVVPQFPDTGLLITDPKNLHLYVQSSSLRRQAKDEPEFDRTADYISQNEAYMIGNLEAAAAIEADNVEFSDADAPVTPGA